MAALQTAALETLMTRDPEEKILRVRRLRAAFDAGELAITHPEPVVAIPVPGRPDRPVLVPPSGLERRGLGSRRGQVALVHAIAHIEFNAINLALDAVYRFPGMPCDYYADWLMVAAEESRHYGLLVRRLRELGSDYGELPAHDGLWQMALQTAHCGLTRMALVPRVLEARGLDVSPGMIQRLRQAGDEATAEILAVILREEESHVEIGTRWYRYCCERRGVDPMVTFRQLLQQHAADMIRGPFNEPARRRAGFAADELALLRELDTGREWRG